MKKTLIALLALASVASALTITEDTTMAPGGNYYAGSFDFTFEVLDIPSETDYILGYYASASASGGYSGNVFTLTNTNGALTLSLDRVHSISVSDGEITGTGTVTNSSVFTADGAAYQLTMGTYKVDYLGGTNGAAAADLYLDGVKVASFTGGNHNMNGGGDGTATLNVVAKNGFQVIPEPATATLSLLALAGLCARRRRA